MEQPSPVEHWYCSVKDGKCDRCAVFLLPLYTLMAKLKALGTIEMCLVLTMHPRALHWENISKY